LVYPAGKRALRVLGARKEDSMKIAYLTLLTLLAGCRPPTDTDPLDTGEPDTDDCGAGYFEYEMGIVYYIGPKCWSPGVGMCLSEEWWHGYSRYDTGACDDVAWVVATTDGRCFLVLEMCSDDGAPGSDPVISHDVKDYEFCLDIFGGDNPGAPEAPKCE
jgi:hypothetical protein